MGIGASDGKVYLVASQNGSGVWTNYNTVISSIGALPSMVLGRGNYGLLQIIGIPDQGTYYQQMCLAAFQNNTSSFSAGGTLPSMSPAVPFSGVGIGGGYNGLIVVGVGASDSHLYVADFQDANNKGAWSAGSELPGPGTGGAQTVAIASPVVASGAGGLQVGGLGTDGQLHMVASQSSSNGSWTAFGSIPTYANSNTYSQIVTAPTSGPSLDIIGLDSASNVVLITYQSSGGTWTQGAVLTGP